MARFEIQRQTSLTAADAWARLTDWERHGEFIPLTTTSRHGHGVGSTFTARTGWGPLGFDDVMRVTEWEPPSGGVAGRCRIVKQGRVIGGWAELEVTPTSTGSIVRWCEDASIRRTGRVLDIPTRLIAHMAFGRLVDGLLRR